MTSFPPDSGSYPEILVSNPEFTDVRHFFTSINRKLYRFTSLDCAQIFDLVGKEIAPGLAVQFFKLIVA
jgi:hypothetical protein